MQDQPGRRRLTRSADRKLGGVSGGLAEYFGVDPTMVRLAFILLAVISMGAGALILYAAMWAIMPPPDPNAPPSTADTGNSALLVGVALVIFGVALLFQRLPLFWWVTWGMHNVTWPALLIVAGVLVLLASHRR